MRPTPRQNRIPIMMSDAELSEIDDWRFANHVATRADAVRRLCQIAIGQKSAGYTAGTAHVGDIPPELILPLQRDGAREIGRAVLSHIPADGASPPSAFRLSVALGDQTALQVVAGSDNVLVNWPIANRPETLVLINRARDLVFSAASSDAMEDGTGEHATET